jgi:xanthine dehydrogenase accessory factor
MNALNPSSPEWPAWPHYALVEDLLPAIRDFAHAGPVALATLVSTEGASPRPLGSEMAIAADGRVAGYVSGGCVEAAVAAEAMDVMRDGVPRLLDYGAGSPVLDIQLSCGGRIGIHVRRLDEPLAYVHQLEQARTQRATVTVVTDAATGQWRVAPGAVQALDGAYARVHQPPLHVVAVGGDPVTLALAQLAASVGVAVTLLRPHGPPSPPHGIPLAAYDPRALGVALAALALDDRTAVYSLSHDADVDHAVCLHALRSPAFAVGVLGSRHKIAQRLQRLRDDGIDDPALRRLHLPAGLAVGAQTPHGIALSILAQVYQQDRARQP